MVEEAGTVTTAEAAALVGVDEAAETAVVAGTGKTVGAGVSVDIAEVAEAVRTVESEQVEVAGFADELIDLVGFAGNVIQIYFAEANG